MLNAYLSKLRYIFLPLVAIVLLFLVVYGLLYEAVVLYWNIYDPSFAVQYWLGFAFSALLLLVLLRPRLKLLRRGRDDRWVMLFYLVPALGMTFAGSFVGDYLRDATGRLTALRYPSEALQQPATYFYTFQHAYPHKPGLGARTITTITGKNNNTLNMEVFVVCPLLDSPADTTRRPVAAWLTWHQQESMPVSLSDSEKEARYTHFMARCDSLFQQTDLTKFTYLTHATAEDKRTELQVAVQNSSFYQPSTPEPLLLVPQSGLFQERTQAPLRHIAWCLGITMGLYMLMLLFPRVATIELIEWQEGQRPASFWQDVAPYVLPRTGYQVTPLLLLLNSLIFLVMLLSFGDVSFRAPDLISWGGNYAPLIRVGQWWRLLVSGFLHGGLMHWLQNMLTLGLMGWLLEQRVGPARLAGLYLLSIMGANLLSVWWHPTTVSVGASGGIFGLFGFSAALALSFRVSADERGTLLLLPGAPCAINLLLGWVMPGTNNAAHLGGLACGLALGTLIARTLPQSVD